MKLIGVDRWVIAYSAITSAVALIFSASQATFWPSHLFHALAILLALAIARWTPENELWAFIRYGYPVALFGFFYRDTQPYVLLIFDHWFDPALMAWEQQLIGANISTALAGIDSKALLELWMAGYAFYYVIAPVAITVMIWNRRPDLFRRMTLASTAAFFVSYMLFYLYPLEGPRHALAATLPPLEGWLFYPLVMSIQNAGSIHGGCMPSSHTAVAWIVTYYVFKAQRTAGHVFVALSALLTVGCVWGRFHYVTDVVVGITLFAICIYLTERFALVPQPTAWDASTCGQTSSSDRIHRPLKGKEPKEGPCVTG